MDSQVRRCCPQPYRLYRTGGLCTGSQTHRTRGWACWHAGAGVALVPRCIRGAFRALTIQRWDVRIVVNNRYASVFYRYCAGAGLGAPQDRRVPRRCPHRYSVLVKDRTYPAHLYGTCGKHQGLKPGHTCQDCGLEGGKCCALSAKLAAPELTSEPGE